MVVEISARLKHECPFLEFSSHFGKKTIYHYCSQFNDYLVISGKLTINEKELASQYFGRFNNMIIKEIGNNLNLTYIIIDCPAISEKYEIISSSIDQKIRRLQALPIYPITYHNGFEYYKIYTKDIEKANHFIKTMQQEYDFELLGTNDLGEDWIISQTAVLNQLFEELTPIQIDVLKQAFEGGYYTIPRAIKMNDLAEKNKKTRYAIERNVRSAENKIINYIMPFMYLHQSNIHMKPCADEKLTLKTDH